MLKKKLTIKELTAMHYADYLRTPHWRLMRTRTLARDKQTCQLCKRKNSDANKLRLQVHHKTYERIGCERLTDLVTLCQSCHKALHQLKIA